LGLPNQNFFGITETDSLEFTNGRRTELEQVDCNVQIKVKTIAKRKQFDKLNKLNIQENHSGVVFYKVGEHQT